MGVAAENVAADIGIGRADQDASARAGMTIDHFAVIESNEVFAAQACGVNQQLGLNAVIVNPNGGTIALGHPVGASGAIIMTKLLYALKRRGTRSGLATMCIGGGQEIVMIEDNIRAN